MQTVEDNQSLFTACGVGPEFFEHFSMKLEKLPVIVIREGYAWFLGIMETEYLAVQRIRRDQKESAWAMYAASPELFGELREVVKFRKVAYAFKLAIRSKDRPNLFRKNKHVKIKSN